MIVRKGPQGDYPWSLDEGLRYQDSTVWEGLHTTYGGHSILQVEIEVEDFKQIFRSALMTNREEYAFAVRQTIPFEEIGKLIEFWLDDEGTRERMLQMIAQVIIATDPGKPEEPNT